MKNIFTILALLLSMSLIGQPLIINSSATGGGGERCQVSKITDEVKFAIEFETNARFPNNIIINTGHANTKFDNVRPYLLYQEFRGGCLFYRYIIDVTAMVPSSSICSYPNFGRFEAFVGLFVGNECLYDYSLRNNLGLFNSSCISSSCNINGGLTKFNLKVCCNVIPISNPDTPSNPFGGKRFNNSETIVTPNPFTNVIEINSDNSIHSLRLLNLNGQSVADFVNINEDYTGITTSNLIAGIYLLVIEYSDGSTDIQKLVKR